MRRFAVHWRVRTKSRDGGAASISFDRVPYTAASIVLRVMKEYLRILHSAVKQSVAAVPADAVDVPAVVGAHAVAVAAAADFCVASTVASGVELLHVPMTQLPEVQHDEDRANGCECSVQESHTQCAVNISGTRTFFSFSILSRSAFGFRSY
jgi:hypothetical protein